MEMRSIILYENEPVGPPSGETWIFPNSGRRMGIRGPFSLHTVPTVGSVTTEQKLYCGSSHGHLIAIGHPTKISFKETGIYTYVAIPESEVKAFMVCFAPDKVSDDVRGERGDLRPPSGKAWLLASIITNSSESTHLVYISPVWDNDVKRGFVSIPIGVGSASSYLEAYAARFRMWLTNSRYLKVHQRRRSTSQTYIWAWGLEFDAAKVQRFLDNTLFLEWYETTSGVTHDIRPPQGERWEVNAYGVSNDVYNPTYTYYGSMYGVIDGERQSNMRWPMSAGGYFKPGFMIDHSTYVHLVSGTAAPYMWAWVQRHPV